MVGREGARGISSPLVVSEKDKRGKEASDLVVWIERLGHLT